MFMKRLPIFMNDTSPKMAKKMCELIRTKSPVERMAMGWSMYETSKALVIRFILENNPNISDEDFRKEFFLKFYKNDFSPSQREKIIEHLKHKSSFKPPR